MDKLIIINHYDSLSIEEKACYEPVWFVKGIDDTLTKIFGHPDIEQLKLKFPECEYQLKGYRLINSNHIQKQEKSAWIKREDVLSVIEKSFEKMDKRTFIDVIKSI